MNSASAEAGLLTMLIAFGGDQAQVEESLRAIKKIDVGRMAQAFAKTLAEGYIDLESDVGRGYLEGDRTSFGTDQIDDIARSIVKYYEEGDQ